MPCLPFPNADGRWTEQGSIYLVAWLANAIPTGTLYVQCVALPSCVACLVDGAACTDASQSTYASCFCQLSEMVWS